MTRNRPEVEPHVSEADAFALRMERDPLLRSTIVAVARLDRSPDWGHFTRRMERATRLAPAFRSRLVESPLRLAPPRWIIDPDFDLSWHLRRVGAPCGRDLDAVLDFARTTGMTAFDPARPRWEITLLDDLADGGAALVIKVHHALTDGLGGIQIAAHAVDLEPEPVELDLPPAPRPGRHGTLVDLAEALGHDARTIRDGGWALVTGTPGSLQKIATAPGQTVAGAARAAGSLLRMVRPITSTRSPIMRDRRLQWHYDSLDVRLDALKAASDLADVTLNDAFVTAVATGVRIYHDHHGTMLNELRVTMPISLRTDEDPEGGNHITLTRFDVPVGRSDAVQRMQEVSRACQAERSEPSLALSEQVATVLNRLPPGAVGGMLKKVDLVASNVPGFPAPVYVSGALVRSFHAFGPTTGTAANVTLLSYRGACHVGVNMDSGAVPDPGLFMACLAEGFAETTDLAKLDSRRA